MESSLSKAQIRKTVLHYRKLLSSEVYQKRNEELLNQLDSFLQKMEFGSIHTFLPMVKNKEVDVRPLLPSLRESGKTVIGSRTIFKTRLMQHFVLKEETQLQENRMGIPEPQNAEETNLKSLDIILIPLHTADKHGNRIGYGGGYYDELLSSITALKVGLSLGPLLDQIAQIEAWDEKLDVLITPYQVYEY